MTAPSLTTLLAKHSVETRHAGEHHHVNSGWLGVDCPYCSPGSGRFLFSFYLAGGRANCWQCGRKSPVEALVQLTGIPYAEARAVLRDRTTPIAEKIQHTGRYLPPSGVGPLQPAHRRYLERRGLDPDYAARVWGVGGIGIAAEYQWRLFIPISLNGKPVSWTTRTIGKTGKRYLNSPLDREAVSAKSLLYGAEYARHSVIVVEGPIDAWSIGPGCVATCGLGFSAKQVALIAAYPVRAICFDSEPAAQARAGALCEQLSLMPGVTTNIELETGSDPNECERGEIEDIRAEFLGDSGVLSK